MDEEGLVPDHQIRHALLRCLTAEQYSSSLGNTTNACENIVTVSSHGCAKDDACNVTVTKSQPVSLNQSKSLSMRSSLKPAEIWTFQNWKALRRVNSTLIMRSNVDQQVGGTVRGGEQESGLAKFLFGNSNAATSFVSMNEQMRKVMPQLRDRWSANAMEGFVPKLHWNANELQKSLAVGSTPFAASRKLRRQVTLGETKFQREFPNLSMDLSNEFGTKCPNRNCLSNRCLSIGEIYQGWGANAGDLNKYTTTCVHCGKEFIPRFNLSFGDVKQETVWIEFLSPWVLHKELVNIVLDDGISTLLSRRFRVDEKSTVFWNALIAFRLRGLPISFLITNGLITDAFPPK
jgi:hypothetical protein